MKGLIKFLPVAFGALVLASCSNNDLLGLGEDQVSEYQLKEGEILVTVDEDQNATRASIGEAIKETDGVNDLYRSVFWREGDQIKVYDDDVWRPQYFKFANNADAVVDYYKNAAGPIPAVFALDQTLSPKGTDAEQYKEGYAVFPGEKFSQFEGEERAKLNFDYNKMKYWSWDALTTNYFTENGDGKSWYTEFPMWGNVKDKKLALKYLTGFLRIDLSGYKEITTETRASLVIQASKQLAGNFTAQFFDYEAKQAPLLVGKAAATTYTSLGGIQSVNTIQDPQSRTATVDDSYTMVINLPVAQLKANQGKMTESVSKHNVFFIPVPVALKAYQQWTAADAAAGNCNADQVGFNKFGADGLPVDATADPYAIRVSLVYDNGAADDDISIDPALYNAATPGDVLFESDAFDGIDKPGRFYNIDCIDAGEVNTPYQLGQLIQKLDKIGRKVTVNLKTAPVVKGNETPQDQNLYVGKLNHDITINLPLGIEKGAGGTDNYHHTPAMYITKSGPGKLTLNFNGGDASKYPAIVIRETGNDTGDYKKIQSSKTESDVIITSDASAGGTEVTLPLVVVETASNVVTLKAAASQVNLKGKMTIDAKDKTIAVLDAKKDGDVLTLKNGTITELKTLYANKFTCNSEGKSFIKEISTPTPESQNNDWEKVAATPAQWEKNGSTPYKHCYNNVTLNSVWDGVYYTGTDFPQQKDIHTAAQFSIGGYVASSALHTNLFIGTNFDGTEATNAAQKVWAGRDLAQNFDGLGHTVNLLTTKVQNSNGLFDTYNMADGTIKDLNIKANIQPAGDASIVGGLLGQVAANKKVTLYGVKLLDGSKLGFFTEAGNYTIDKGSQVGGLVGKMNASSSLTAYNCSVKGEIAGFAALGGYVGLAAADAILQFGIQNKNAITNLYTDVFGNQHAAAAYAISTSEVTFKEMRTIPTNLFNPLYGTIGMFLGKAELSTSSSVNLTIESDQWSASTAQAVVANDNIAGNETTLKFNKHHILAGYDANGNEMYYNYAGSTFNVIGTIGDKGAKRLPVVKIGDGYWGTPTPGYQYFTLGNRQKNETNTDVAGIETAYMNWFSPDAVQ